MKKGTPPSKNVCLEMAKYCHQSKFESTQGLAWAWLLCWAAYDDWIELYWEKA